LSCTHLVLMVQRLDVFPERWAQYTPTVLD